MTTAHLSLSTLDIPVFYQEKQNFHVLASKGMSTGIISVQSHREFILHFLYRMLSRSDWLERNKSY